MNVSMNGIDPAGNPMIHGCEVDHDEGGGQMGSAFAKISLRKRRVDVRTAIPPRERPSGTGARRIFSSLIDIQDKIDVRSRLEPVSLVTGFDLAIGMILKTSETGHKVIFVGNGGSAAIASHMALDFWNAGGIDATSFNDAAQLTCMANDRGYENVFAEPIRRFARIGDTLVAISSSGRSANILNAVRAAKEKGCSILTLSAFDADNPLRRSDGLDFYVPSSSYGIVEISHLWILVSMLEEILRFKKSRS